MLFYIILFEFCSDDEGHRSKLLAAQKVDGKIVPPVNSRLESILRSSNALQSRIRAETRKITTDPGDLYICIYTHFRPIFSTMICDTPYRK